MASSDSSTQLSFFIENKFKQEKEASVTHEKQRMVSVVRNLMWVVPGSPFKFDRLTGNLGLQLPLSSPPPFFWDLSNSIWMSRNKHYKNLIPCITRGHTMWDVLNMRPLLGLQLMMAQGSPNDLKAQFDPADASIHPSRKSSPMISRRHT